MVRFGMPALMEADSIGQAAALCSQLGLSFIELNTNFPTQQLHLLSTGELNRLADQYGIGYTIHLNDEMPVADFHPAVARGYREAVLEAISFAEAVGAKVINMHISEGAHYTMPHKKVYFYESYLSAYLEGMTAFRDACTAAIGGRDIHICMENTTPYRPFQKAALDLLLESPCFALTLDIGHNYCSGFADEDWILARKGRLRHMHIHDAASRVRDHLPLGEGELDLARYLSLAEECDCTAVLEVKTEDGLRRSANYIKNRSR